MNPERRINLPVNIRNWIHPAWGRERRSGPYSWGAAPAVASRGATMVVLALGGLTLLLAGCGQVETKHRHFDRRVEWPDAPPYLPPSATDVDLARNLDLECRQWVRFTFAAADSQYLATYGDSSIAASSVTSASSPPRWWSPPSDRQEATARSISDAGWRGSLLVMWGSRRAYFVGC